jgi:hypothetical protein
VLDRLDPAGTRLQECLDRLAQLAQAWVGLFAVPRRRAVDSIEHRADLQNFAPCFEKIVVKDSGRVARVDHLYSFLAFSKPVSFYHGKTVGDMQTVGTIKGLSCRIHRGR